MAQHKYDLITVPTAPKGPYRHHPWYKERLQLKFLKTSKQSAALDGGRWTFLSGDIDDFRTGAPVSKKSVLKKGPVNFIPLIDSRSTETLKRSNSRMTPRPKPRILTGNPGLRTLYKKTGPRRQLQQEHVNEVEASLLQHPLGIYPHLEESIPPEMLDDMIGILDPQLNEVISDSEMSSSTASEESMQSDPVLHQDPAKITPEESPTQVGVYKFPLKKTKEEKEREKSLLASRQVISATQQSKVDQVTHDLVQWVADLGCSDNSQNGIDDSTIKSLFGSDYESKPILMAPIHVVELDNVPAELRLESRERSRGEHSSAPSPHAGGGGGVYQGFKCLGRRRSKSLTWAVSEEEPRIVKTKYGAWYLPVGLWKIRSSDEPLRDPREEAAEAECEHAMKNLAMDQKLTELHGAKAFKEFVLTNKRGTTVPKFLKSVNTNQTSQSQKQSTKKHVLQTIS